MALPYDHKYRNRKPVQESGFYSYGVIAASNGIGGGTAANTASNEVQFNNPKRSFIYKHNDTIVPMASPVNQQSVTTYNRLDEAGRYSFPVRLNELLRQSTGKKVVCVSGGGSGKALTNQVTGWKAPETLSQIHALLDAAEAKIGRLNFLVIELCGADTKFSGLSGAAAALELKNWITAFRTARGHNYTFFIMGLGHTPPTLTIYPQWEEHRTAYSKIAMQGVHYVPTHEKTTYADDIHDTLLDGTTKDEVHWNASGHNKIADEIYKQAMLFNYIEGAKRLDLQMGNMGDSTTDQGTNPNIYEALGYQVVMNALLGNRFIYSNSRNFGLSADDSQEMSARNSEVLTAYRSGQIDFITIMGFANDRSAKRSAQWTIDNLTLMIESWQGLGLPVVAFSCLPRPDINYYDKGFTASEIAAEKVKDVQVDDFLRNYPNVIFIDASVKYNTNIDDVTSDTLHLNALGGFIIGEAGADVLEPLWGYRGFRPHENNVLPAPLDLEGQLISYNFATPDSGTVTEDHFDLVSTSYNGQSAWYQAEIGFPQSSADLRTMDVSLRTDAGRLVSGFDRGNELNNFPMGFYKQWHDRKGRNIIITTPVGVLPDTAFIQGNINLEMNTDLATGSGAVSIYNRQLVVE